MSFALVKARAQLLANTYLRSPTHVAKTMKWWLTASVSDRDHVFVVGPSRSGTTLMQVVLGAHSSFGTLETETALFTLQDPFDRNRMHMGLDADEIEEAQRGANDIVEFFDRLVDRSPVGGLRFVEKTPQHIFRLPFLLSHFPRARFVSMMRDGRDCLCSARGHEWVPHAKSVATFARYWRRCARAHIAAASDPRVRSVKYEDFAANPAEVINDVMVFLGEPAEAAQLDPQVLGADDRSTHKPFLRLGKRIDPSSVARWRQELSPRDLARFERIAGRELLRLGYSLASD